MAVEGTSEPFKTIFPQHGDLTTGFQLGHVGDQCFGVGGVQLEELELVATAQQALDDEGRAGVHRPVVAGVKARHHVDVVLQCGGKRLFRPGGNQLQKAFSSFPHWSGKVAIQSVQPAPAWVSKTLRAVSFCVM